MQNQFILTPYFLDKALPELESLAKKEWILNNPSLAQEATQKRMSTLHKGLASQVENSIQKGKRPVSIAGDCCTTIGVMAGLQRCGINSWLIWFDAHGDFNTWETTPSGFLGGMPLAMLVGNGEMQMPDAVGLIPFPEEQVILTDGRDLDPEERILVESSSVIHLTDVGDLLDYPFGDRPLYIHFDVDIIDPSEVPAVSYPAPGGPSSSQLKEVFHHLATIYDIVALSLSAWNPELDHDGSSQKLCMETFEILIPK